MRKTIATTTALLALTGVTAAKGATNPYTPKQVCGGGYGVIDTQPITAPGKRYGTTYLMWSRAEQKNCVVTIKSIHVGQATHMAAGIRVSPYVGFNLDEGNFKYYAGPEYVYAPKKCIQWEGGIENSGFDTAWEHCN